MILGNYTVINSHPGRAIGGFTNLYSNYKPGGWYSFYDPDVEDQQTRLNSKASFPTGTQPHYSWVLAPKGGEMSATTRISGTGSIAGNAAMGINIEADLTGVGTISSAALSSVVGLIANLTGVGTLSASMVGTVQMAASLIGTGSVTAGVSLLANLIASLTGTGTVTADLKGTASLEAIIYVNQSEETVQQIVDAVWNALAAEYNLAGTMGEALNGAGGAGNPWITDLSAYTTPNTAGKILKDAADSAELASIK